MNGPPLRVGFLTAMVRCCCGLLVLASTARAQDGGMPQAYSKTPVFYIPFSSDGNERRWRQVTLYVSTDQGRNWKLQSNAPPSDGRFTFTADRDGVYWFATQTMDLDNRTFPPTMDNAAPQLKVTVDTQAPFIVLRGLPPQDGQAQIQWDVRDDNLDLNGLTVDYRVQGSEDWRPLRIDPIAAGRFAWRPSTNATLEVRLRARDKAGNESEQKATVLPGEADGRITNDSRPNTGYIPDPARSESYATSARPRGNVPYKFVNNKHIEINYKLKDVGKSGVSVVELWYTQDSGRESRAWKKYHTDQTFDRVKPPEPTVFPWDVHDEGIYGVSLVIKSGVGFHEKPPAVNDLPQLWIEVDTTKPVVKMGKVEVGRGDDTGKLFISYLANDKNLSQRPITLSYATTHDGPWTPIHAELENTGRFTWQMPSDLPFEFFVKVEATDKAGNVGADQTQGTVKVDLSIPKAEFLDVGAPKH